MPRGVGGRSPPSYQNTDTGPRRPCVPKRHVAKTPVVQTSSSIPGPEASIVSGVSRSSAKNAGSR